MLVSKITQCGPIPLPHLLCPSLQGCCPQSCEHSEKLGAAQFMLKSMAPNRGRAALEARTRPPPMAETSAATPEVAMALLQMDTLDTRAC